MYVNNENNITVMKNWLFLFLLLISASCVDEEPIEKHKGDTVNAKLNFWLPTLSTVAQTKAMEEVDEYRMTNLTLLIFDKDNKFVEEKVITIQDGEGTEQQTASIMLEKADQTQSLVALANMDENYPKPGSKEDKETYLAKLRYASENAWPTADGKRFFPMWGEYTGALQAETININMLRALARVNITVAEGVKFALKEFTVHNSSKGGYVAPIKNELFTEKGNVTIPSIPEGITKGNLIYEIPEANASSFEREIYIPEANTDADAGVYFTLSGEIAGVAKLYRLYLTNNGMKTGTPMQVLRNHTYNIKITKAGGLNDLTVTIEAMDECAMRSPYEQNTLTVSSNLFYFNPEQSDPATLGITTTWGEWSIVDTKLEGFTVVADHATNTVLINPTNLNGISEGYFYVQSGQLKKKIMVKIDPAETSNCYIRGETGDYPLCVTVKGNGRDGMVADGKVLVSVDDLKLLPTKIGIIWETSDGLVRLVDGSKHETSMNVSGIDFGGVVQYHVDLDKFSMGGNALIGAFDDKGTCIWSWHIWVVPEFKGPDGQLNVKTEAWDGNSKSYTFIDRYIGALSSKPGDEALGLLYQWGRKDPFIGAKGPQDPERRSTVNYRPCGVGTRTYTWGVTNIVTLAESIKFPTDLLTKGLCNVDENGTYLWGTPSGMEMYGGSAVNEGNKTIYDPCPVGYRVPPLLAYLFKENYNYKTNYNGNNSYIPTGNEYDGEASRYGFWVNYKANERPKVGNASNSVSNGTWFPLAGVYNPGSWLIGEDVKYEFSKVDEENSLKVNSIVWTNTPIKYGIDGDAYRPGAMFLHGAESENSKNGRHLHRFIETSNDLYAQTQFAGSVRCVKIQAAQDFNELNEFPKEIYLGASVGSKETATIKVINETWEVVNPGAPWFYLNKYSGDPDGGVGQSLVFTASERNTGKSRTATLTVKTSKGFEYEIEVIQSRR